MTVYFVIFGKTENFNMKNLGELKKLRNLCSIRITDKMLIMYVLSSSYANKKLVSLYLLDKACTKVQSFSDRKYLGTLVVY